MGRAPYGIRRRCQTSPSVALEIGFVEGSAIVHLTRTSLVSHALCGEDSIAFHGEPDLAVMCEECDWLGRELHGDPETSMRVTVAGTHVLRHAA